MKTTKKPKLKKERSVSSLAKKVWALTREIALKREIAKSGKINCYTCGAKDIQGSNCQLGHGYPKGALGVSMQYDLRILRFQDYNCNINRGGMGAEFWKNLEVEYGEEEADSLYWACKFSKGNPIKARPYLTALIEERKKILADLSTDSLDS